MFFADELAVERVGLGFLNRSLPKSAWTHAGHFAATIWILTRRHDIDAESEMPGLIRAYNVVTGVVNSDTTGYHETITLASIRVARAFLSSSSRAEPLHVTTDALLRTRLGAPVWLLDYWTRDVLYSTQARKTWVAPDIRGDYDRCALTGRLV